MTPAFKPFSGRSRFLTLRFVPAALVLLTHFVGATAASDRNAAEAPGIASFSWIRTPSPDPLPPSSALRVLGADLFRRNCAICHGRSGQGNGMWAHMLFPKPRNFTRGIFRFKTTESGSLPTSRSLFRTVSIGVQGTAMPAWQDYLSERERWAVIQYIKTFSDFFKQVPPGTPVSLGPEPRKTAAQVAQGERLYKTAGCASCHGVTGHGDGPSSEEMEDSFGSPIRPRDFHQAREFKRGRTPRDIALTITTGNDGTPMPSFKNALTRADVWAVAHYVMSMPVEPPKLRPSGHRMMGRRTGNFHGSRAGH